MIIGLNEVIYLLYAVITLTFNFAEAVAVVNGGATRNAEWSVALGLMSAMAYIYIELFCKQDCRFAMKKIAGRRNQEDWSHPGR